MQCLFLILECAVHLVWSILTWHFRTYSTFVLTYQSLAKLIIQNYSIQILSTQQRLLFFLCPWYLAGKRNSFNQSTALGDPTNQWAWWKERGISAWNTASGANLPPGPGFEILIQIETPVLSFFSFFSQACLDPIHGFLQMNKILLYL